MLFGILSAWAVGFAVAGFFLALLGVFLDEINKLDPPSLKWTLTAFSVLSGLIAALLQSLYFAHRNLSARDRAIDKLVRERDDALARPALKLPRVVRGWLLNDNTVRLLFEPSLLFGTNSAVSIYGQRNGFDILLGEGRVATVQQENGHIQVVVTSFESDSVDIWKGLVENQAHLLTSTFARPGSQSR